MTDAPAPTRTSSRVRNKSARAVESESTEKMLAATRGKGGKDAVMKEGKEGGPAEAAGPGGEEGVEGIAAEAGSAARPTRATRSRGGAEPKKQKAALKPRKSKYCVCKTHKTGSMIECGECGNWCV